MATITTLDQPIRELGTAQTAVFTTGNSAIDQIAAKAREFKAALTAKTDESDQRQAEIQRLNERITNDLVPQIERLTVSDRAKGEALERVTATKDRAEAQVRDLTDQNRALQTALEKALRDIADLKAAAESNQRTLGERTAQILLELNQ